MCQGFSPRIKFSSLGLIAGTFSVHPVLNKCYDLWPGLISFIASGHLFWKYNRRYYSLSVSIWRNYWRLETPRTRWIIYLVEEKIKSKTYRKKKIKKYRGFYPDRALLFFSLYFVLSQLGLATENVTNNEWKLSRACKWYCPDWRKEIRSAAVKAVRKENVYFMHLYIIYRTIKVENGIVQYVQYWQEVIVHLHDICGFGSASCQSRLFSNQS